MKTKLFFLIFLFPFAVLAQTDTVFYFGVNGKVKPSGKQQIMKKINYHGSKINVKTYQITISEWQPVYKEKVKIVSDSVYEIRIKGDAYTGRVTRKFKQFDKGVFAFTDYVGKAIKRTGYTTQKMPLLLEGTVTEYHLNSKVKSVSEFRKNELISNKNWQQDGTPLVDNIFYSVETEPGFEPGMGFLYQQIRQAITNSKFDLLTVEGRVVIGVVITSDGKIGGVQIVKGISNDLNGILVRAFQDIKGAWIPAKLDDRNVNYFQLIPINFIYSKYNFDYVEMKSGMLYWRIN